jgi:altronate hydrolase
VTDARALLLHPDDDVAVAIDDLLPGSIVVTGTSAVTATARVPLGHKIAIRPIALDAPMRKYGQVIGFASRPVDVGQHVHTHNLRFGEFARGIASATHSEPAICAPSQPMTFEGYRRSDGRVGTRNYLVVLSTVNCSASVAKRISQQMTMSGELDDCPNVDGVVAITHSTGCGLDLGGPGLIILRRTLAGYLTNANVAGVLVLGLGCEDNQIATLLEGATPRADLPFSRATIQELGGTAKSVDQGLETLRSMLPAADAARRSTEPVSELILGTNCGGSDAFSGLTANPGLGAAVDRLVAYGGSGILGETPEIYGAEHLLASRAADSFVEAALLNKIEWWRDYSPPMAAAWTTTRRRATRTGG